MKLTILLILILCVLPGLTAASGKANSFPKSPPPNFPATTSAAAPVFSLADFGAVGDGVSDDGPALQSALNAIADAGGGTLFVPAGRYAIVTPVQKNFTGLAADVSIVGVESLTPVAPPNSSGQDLTKGLDLKSEFAPRTHEQANAITIVGAQTFLIKDIGFIGTSGATTDAIVTLALRDVGIGTIRHCEFYGVSSIVSGGSVVQAVRTNLKLEQTVFLGSTGNSGYYAPVVENLEWKGISVVDTNFADYGQRGELYGKLGVATPFSWINIGNSAATQSNSSRREVFIKNVFLDEGGYFGIASVPYRYQPPTAPIDLLYISGLYMNVSNLATSGHYLYGIQRVLVENSHYGWSHNADSAIYLLNVNNAILDKLECVEHANRLRADAATGKLTIINSVYTYLDSQAGQTRVLVTSTPDQDPVQYVRQQFLATLGRDPDPAAHFYWSNEILRCVDDVQCAATRRTALATYLGSNPSPTFNLSGQVLSENGTPVAGVLLTLGGSQAATTLSDANGNYLFTALPTGGEYTITPTRPNYTFNLPQKSIITPAGDITANFTGQVRRYRLNGRVINGAGEGIAGAGVVLTGSQTGAVTTDASGNYTFDVPMDGDYLIKVSRTNYTFGTSEKSYTHLSADQTFNFVGTIANFSISGQVLKGGAGLGGVTISLTGSRVLSTITNAGGNYSFSVPAEGNYTITPSLKNYSFDVSQKSYTSLSANQTFNFAASLVQYTISGRVMNGSTALSGVKISLTGSQTQDTTTNAAGDYSFSVPAEGNYTITPSLKHYTFSSSANSFTNLGQNQTANFTAILDRHTITGKVATNDGQALGGALVQLTGTQTSSTTTDSSGNYSFPDLAGGGNYTVAVSHPDYGFAVSSFNYSDLSSNQVANFSGVLLSYLISGRITSGGSGLAGALVTLSGSVSATTLTDSQGNYSLRVVVKGNYLVTPTKEHYLFMPEALNFQNVTADSLGDFTGELQPILQFSSSNYTVTEGTRTVTVTVTRSGNTSKAAAVIYSAIDGSAQQRSDVIPVIGRLDFAAGETSKNFIIFITDDSYVEGDENLVIELIDPVGGQLGNINTAMLTVVDNDVNQVQINPIDDAQFFVRQHYRDFLNRPPDDAGLAFWSDQITKCGTDADCIADRRMNVSAAFFLSIEFQETGFLVYRLYEASYAQHPEHVDEFLLDSRTIGEGLIVGDPGWQQLLEARKSAFIESFVRRAQFGEAYPLELTPAAFVNQLNANAGSPLASDEIAAAVNEFAGAASSEDTSARARVLRRVAENRIFSERQTNPAFVLMQYFGYLQRNPDELPDNNLDGYTFWLNKLEEYGGDFRRAEMVKAFILSGEYRARFGSH